jgi:hypothetical protein
MFTLAPCKLIVIGVLAIVVCARAANAENCRAPCKMIGKESPICVCRDTKPKYTGPPKDGPMLKPEPTPAARSPTRPKSAGCLVGGVMRNDVPARDCEEARRTGCVRHLLTPDQYKNCLKAQDAAYKSGRRNCIIGGKVRADLSDLDCEEAKATGCVRRLLTPAQYTACLNAQPQR